MKNFRKILSLVFSLTLIVAFTGCESSEEMESGRANVAVTDAAVDAENITGVFLSVGEIRAHSNSEAKVLTKFDSPQTFNLMDYQNGSSYELGEGELEVGTYSEIRFILEGESYVQFDDGSTQDLNVPSGTTSGYKITGEYEVAANSVTDIVVDIDLRKALVLTGDGQYKLRPTARLVINDNTGTITGSISSNNEDRVVVYAYAKGTYSENEAAEPAEGSTRFEGSVNSGVVTNGTFTLAFMEEGEYELIVATYDHDETTEEYTFKSTTNVDIMLNGSIKNLVEVEANSTVDLLLDINL